MQLIEQGELPPTRTMRDLLGGLVVECDRPPRDEPWCDIAEREGAHVGGMAGMRSDYAEAFDEWNWLQSKKAKHIISKGDADAHQENSPQEDVH
jgi:hypothetical protein